MTLELMTAELYLRIDPDDAATFGRELKRLIATSRADAFSVEVKIDCITIKDGLPWMPSDPADA